MNRDAVAHPVLCDPVDDPVVGSVSQKGANFDLTMRCVIGVGRDVMHSIDVHRATITDHPGTVKLSIFPIEFAPDPIFDRL